MRLCEALTCMVPNAGYRSVYQLRSFEAHDNNDVSRRKMACMMLPTRISDDEERLPSFPASVTWPRREVKWGGISDAVGFRLQRMTCVLAQGSSTRAFARISRFYVSEIRRDRDSDMERMQVRRRSGWAHAVEPSVTSRRPDVAATRSSDDGWCRDSAAVCGGGMLAERVSIRVLRCLGLYHNRAS